MYRNRRLIIRKLAVTMLAFVVAVTFTPLLGDSSFAASSKSGKKYDEKVKYIQKDSNGNEKELDPEIFTGDGKVINADELENLGINISAEPNVPAPEMSKDAELPGLEDLIKDSEDSGSDGKTSIKGSDKLMSEISEVEEARTEEIPGDKSDEVSGDEETPEQTEPVAGESTEGSDAAVTGDENAADKETAGDAEVKAEDVAVTVEEKSKDTVSIMENIVYGNYSVKSPNSSGNIYVNCTLQSDTKPDGWVIDILVDGYSYWKSKPWTGSGSYAKYTININNEAVNISNLSPGSHTVQVKLTANKYWYTPTKSFTSSVYNAPSSGAGQFAFYSNYFDYMSPAFDFVAINKGYKLYMDYYQNGAYAGTIGPMNYYQSAQVGGLAPSTNYQVYIYYGKVVSINGRNYFLSGKDNGRTTYCGTFQTGAASLPKVKSVKVKATKVKKRRAGVYGWYTGYYFGSVKYYTYKIKVTVKFKKKPGLNGLYINGAWKPGNKKKYTLTLGPYANYSKPRGKKFNVYLYSAVAPGGYGGYSPMVAKTKKVK